MIFSPALYSSSAAIEPTLPKPCTTAVAPLSLMCLSFITRRARCATPRPVASRRPSVPPARTGLPVTISVTVRPACME